MNPGNHRARNILFVGILFLILAGIGGFLFIKRNETPSSPPSGLPGVTSDKLFPFGSGTSSGTPVSTVSGTDAGTAVTTPPANGTPIQVASKQALRPLTNYPVTNFYPFTKNQTLSSQKLDEKTGATVTTTSVVPADMVRWNQASTGFLFDAELDPDTITASQKTATQVPDAQELWFANAGNTPWYRSWDVGTQAIDTFHGTYPVAATLSYCTIPFTQNLKVGSKGAEVKELQKYLNQKLSLTLATDGSFGKKTSANLASVQATLGIPASGAMDDATIAAINADCATITAAFAKSQSQPVKLVSGALGTANILRGTVSPDSTQLFYLTDTTDGVSGTVVKSDGTGAKNVFSSPITEWMPQWSNASVIGMTTLASAQADGYLYFLNPTNGNFAKILGPITGLTTNVSPNGQIVLYSSSTDSGIATHLYDSKTGTTADLDLATLPDKCVWQGNATIYCGVPKSIPTGSYPDDWYQGSVSFDDQIWSINVATGVTSIVNTPDQPIDATKLNVSPDGNYLYFINKTDGTLWSLALQ